MADVGIEQSGAIFVKKRPNAVGVSPKTVSKGAKSSFLKKPEEGALPTWAGDYELKLLTITSPNRPGGPKNYINLKAAWSDFNIYEDMFANCLTANIQITDSIGLMESLPIIGEETIRIKVQTAGIKKQRKVDATGPFAGSENEGLIDLKFRVIKISNIVKLNEGTYTYKLSMVSEEYILNQKKKVKKSSLDPVTLEPRKISDVVQSLYRQFFEKGRPTKKRKKIFIEPTKNPTNLIIPNYTPFRAFNFLASRAVSAGKHAVGSSFVFYETIRGFFFISIETLMAGGGLGYTAELSEDQKMAAPGAPLPTELVYTQPEAPDKEVYVVQPKRLNKNTDQPSNVGIELVAVDTYQFSSNFDVLENLEKGMYTNTLLTHDLVRMKYEKLEFDMYDEQGAEAILDEETGATEIKDWGKVARDANRFTDTFTHLQAQKLCTPNQDALRNKPKEEEALLCFYPSNFGHDVVFSEDLGSQGVTGRGKSSLNIIPNRVEQWLQSRLVQNQQMNNIKLNIRAPGLSTRTVGDLIEFRLPTQYVEEQQKIAPDEKHSYLSGFYLITKLRHHLTREKYEIEFEAIKDSLVKTLPEKLEDDPSAIAQEYTESRIADFQATGDTSRGF